MARGDPHLHVRLPPEIRGWVIEQAGRNSCSMNAEIVRALREKMDRAEMMRPSAVVEHRRSA